MKSLTSLIILSVLLVGCSSNSPAPEKVVQANLNQNIDCSTSNANIKTLESEKARTSQEIEAGASSIIPIGAVAHMLGGSEKENLEIGTGQYNKKLDAKISEIKKQCNL